MTVAYGWVPDTEWGTSPLWQASLTATNQTLQTTSYHYLITDHLGTPQLAINNQGQQTWKMHSDAFGNAALDPNNQITLNLRFPGQYYDKETGLSYNYFRDYNPKIGRYIQSDPIGLNGGINTFSYVGGNPLLYRDPYGKIPIVPGIMGCMANPSCAALMVGAAAAIGFAIDHTINELYKYNRTLLNNYDKGYPFCASVPVSIESKVKDYDDNIPRNPDPRCDPDEELNTRYHEWKKLSSQQKKCSDPGLTLEQIEDIIKIKEKYHAARKRHHDFCYQGGNKGHKDQLMQISVEIKKCYVKKNELKKRLNWW
nr:RHS repeat-associated core domain-containing protein [Gilliamella sp. Pas-s25]